MNHNGEEKRTEGGKPGTAKHLSVWKSLISLRAVTRREIRDSNSARRKSTIQRVCAVIRILVEKELPPKLGSFRRYRPGRRRGQRCRKVNIASRAAGCCCWNVADVWGGRPSPSERRSRAWRWGRSTTAKKTPPEGSPEALAPMRANSAVRVVGNQNSRRHRHQRWDGGQRAITGEKKNRFMPRDRNLDLRGKARCGKQADLHCGV